MFVAHAEAACPQPQRSQGGAELYFLSNSIRVRFEQRYDGADVGLKLLGFGEDFVREVRDRESSEVVEITGKIDGHVAARVVLLDDLLVVSSSNGLLIRDGNGHVRCESALQAPDAELIRSKVKGSKIRRAEVSVTTPDSFARQLGL
jgi:hypothetical protein